MPDATTLRLTIRGRVQGVGFRAWVSDRADEQGIAGWVRNRRDGSVEALVSGPSDVVDRFVQDVRRGPPGARVKSVDIEPSSEQPPVFFEVRSTA
jgi:acylphosphatase